MCAGESRPSFQRPSPPPQQQQLQGSAAMHLKKSNVDDDVSAIDSDSLPTKLKALAHNGDVAGAEQVLLLIEQDCSGITLEMYNYVIHACATAQDTSRAEFHLDRLKKLGLEPNLTSYNSVINAYAALGDAIGAEAWIGRMVENGVQPSQVTYGTLCKVLARKGLVRQVQAIMDMVERNGIALNEYFYASLIAACRITSPRDGKSAERALEDLAARGLRPQSVRRALERVVGQRRVSQLLAALESAKPGQEAPYRPPATIATIVAPRPAPQPATAADAAAAAPAKKRAKAPVPAPSRTAAAPPPGRQGRRGGAAAGTATAAEAGGAAQHGKQVDAVAPQRLSSVRTPAAICAIEACCQDTMRSSKIEAQAKTTAMPTCRTVDIPLAPPLPLKLLGRAVLKESSVARGKKVLVFSF